MTNSQRLSTVRDQLIRWITSQNGAAVYEGSGSAEGSPILSESILIRDGFYCGRRFDLGSHRAVWFLEEDVLKIYSSQGELKCVLTGEQLGEIADERADREQVFTMPGPAAKSSSAEKGADDADHEGEIRRAA